LSGTAGVPPAMSAKREKCIGPSCSPNSCAPAARLRAGRPRSQQITCVALLRRLICPHMFNDEPLPSRLALENDHVVSLQLCFGDTRSRDDCLQVVSAVVGQIAGDFSDQASRSEVWCVTFHCCLEDRANSITSAKPVSGAGQEYSVRRVQGDNIIELLLPPILCPLTAHPRESRRKFCRNGPLRWLLICLIKGVTNAGGARMWLLSLSRSV